MTPSVAPTMLVFSPAWCLETVEEGRVVMFHRYTGKRLQLTSGAYRILREFSTARPTTDLANILFKEHAQQLASLIYKHNLLISPDADVDTGVAPLYRVEPTLYRAPAGPRSAPTDVTVIGVPYDGGNVVSPGTRFGSQDIRAVSIEQEYTLDGNGVPRGWFDLDSGRQVLQGVTFSDWGNIRVNYGECAEATFQRIEEACRALLQDGTLPVALGGDHSISYPMVKACQSFGEMCVMWFDAHNDLGLFQPPLANHHGNVLRRIAALPNVWRVFIIGQRGFTSWNQQSGIPDNIRTISLQRFREEGLRDALREIPSKASAYISCDVDVLDAPFGSGTATPVIRGMSPDEVSRAVDEICAQCEVGAVDVVEVNCTHDPTKITARSAAHIILRSLMSIFERRRRNSPRPGERMNLCN